MRKGILTDQQRAVMVLVAQGRSNVEIARALVLSKRTVDAHLRNSLDALKAPNRAAAVALALYHGEINFGTVLGTALPPVSPGPVDDGG